MKIALLVLLLVTSAMLTAQTPTPGTKTPDPPKPRQPSLSDDARKNILIDYQMAVIAQDQKLSAEKSSDAATQAYLATCKREATAAGFPDGTQCQVDLVSKIVTPIVPPPAPPSAKKAEEPAAKK